MAIYNLTPDSFSDGGPLPSRRQVHERAERLIENGADVLDVGAESTRPGAQPVSSDAQLRRLTPLFEVLDEISVPVSIDTRASGVAREAVAAGVEIINDVSGGSHDPEMAAVAATHAGPYIAMHMRGTPETMDAYADYEDVAADVMREWRANTAQRLTGIDQARLWFDPGLGFAKNAAQNWTLLRSARALRGAAVVDVWGPSRKRFLGTDDVPARRRDPATHAVVGHLATCGVRVVRVHDPAGARQAIYVADQLRELSP